MEKLAEMPAKGRKGLFIAVSVLMLTAILLIFALSLSGQPAKNGGTALQLLDMGRVADKYAGVESQLRAIILNYINVNVIENRVEIHQKLPLSSGLAQDLDDFEAFEQNFSDMNVTMSVSDLKNGSLFIQPNGVRITQNQNQFNVTADGVSSGAVAGYGITIVFPGGEADDASFTYVPDPNGLNITVLLVDQEYLDGTGPGLYKSLYATINKSATSTINITYGGTQVGYIKFKPNASLEINSSSSADLKTLVRFTNPIYVESNGTLSVRPFANGTSATKTAIMRIS